MPARSVRTHIWKSNLDHKEPFITRAPTGPQLGRIARTDGTGGRTGGSQRWPENHDLDEHGVSKEVGVGTTKFEMSRRNMQEVGLQS